MSISTCHLKWWAWNTALDLRTCSPFELGRELVELDQGIVIGLYSAERSIVDAFRLRGREGRDVANEALRRWIRRRGAEPGRFVALANQLPRASAALRQALEVLL